MKMSASTENVLARRKQGLTIRALDGEVLVYDPSTTRASCLNEFAAEVLARCDGKTTPARIARDLPFENADARVVTLALSDLQKARLFEDDIEIDFTALIGPSRRDFFKRLGAGAAVAVPVVTAITLPTPAAAASLGEACFCTDETCEFSNCAGGLFCESTNSSGMNCEHPGKDCVCKQTMQ
jgi:hypothetical protein